MGTRRIEVDMVVLKLPFFFLLGLLFAKDLNFLRLCDNAKSVLGFVIRERYPCGHCWKALGLLSSVTC